MLWNNFLISAISCFSGTSSSQTTGETDRQTGTGRGADRETDRNMDKQTDRQTEIDTMRYTETQREKTTRHVNIDEVVVTTRAEISVAVSDLQ